MATDTPISFLTLSSQRLLTALRRRLSVCRSAFPAIPCMRNSAPCRLLSRQCCQSTKISSSSANRPSAGMAMPR